MIMIYLMDKSWLHDVLMVNDLSFYVFDYRYQKLKSQNFHDSVPLSSIVSVEPPFYFKARNLGSYLTKGRVTSNGKPLCQDN